MNLGQFLSAKSPISSGTVAQHLAAIAASTGSDRIVYCSQITTVLTQDEITVTRKPKRIAPDPIAAAPSVVEKTMKQRMDFFAFAPLQTDVVAFFEPDEITVTQRATTITVKQDLAQETITRKPSRIAIN